MHILHSFQVLCAKHRIRRILGARKPRQGAPPSLGVMIIFIHLNGREVENT